MPRKSSSLLQMRSYDLVLINSYFHWRPWLPILRFLQITLKFSDFFLGLWWDRSKGYPLATRPRRATQLRQILTDLGPGTIKIGQALSTRPDLVPQ